MRQEQVGVFRLYIGFNCSDEWELVKDGVSRKNFLLSILLFCSTGANLAFESQSLADLAKKEAERRKLLEKEGIKGKVVTPDMIESRTGNISQFSRPARSSPVSREPRAKGSVKSYQDRLKKLDREIRLTEDRIRVLRLRMTAEKRSLDLTMGPEGKQNSNQDRLHWQILELESKLEQTKRDRNDTYHAGIKAGFLPGELEDRGIVP